MTYDVVENTLKSLLQSNVRIVSKKRQLGIGVVQLFEIKDFNIKLIFDNGKKLEILYLIIRKKEIIYIIPLLRVKLREVV